MNEQESSEDILDQCTNYVTDAIAHVVNNFGDRDGGSKGENDAHEYLNAELDKFTDETRMEGFKVAPKAFMSFLPITSVLVLISFIFYWSFPIIAFFLTLTGVMVVVLQFVLYKKLLDPFFPKRTSHNVLLLY